MFILLHFYILLLVFYEHKKYRLSYRISNSVTEEANCIGVVSAIRFVKV